MIVVSFTSKDLWPYLLQSEFEYLSMDDEFVPLRIEHFQQHIRRGYPPFKEEPTNSHLNPKNPETNRNLFVIAIYLKSPAK